MLLYVRSALKKIFERDDTPNRNLVLCVSAICSEASNYFIVYMLICVMIFNSGFSFFRILILVDMLVVFLYSTQRIPG